MVGELIGYPQGLIIAETTIVYHRAQARSCLYNIIMEVPNKVKEACEFVTQRRVTDPTYTCLAPGVFVVEGYPNLYFASLDGLKSEACRNELILEHCNPCLSTMDCECVLKRKGSG